MLNSKNLFSKSYKKALFLNDYPYWNGTFDQIINYLSKLTDSNGSPLLKHRRKTFVLGLIVAAKCIQHLAYKLLTLNVHPFKFWLTYKISQDHLELLLSCIRGMNGFNNNPDGIQLKSSLKRILLRNSIVGSKHANCLTFEDVANGSIFALKWSKKSAIYSNPETDFFNFDIDIVKIQNYLDNTSIYKEAILGYISGFIVKRLLSKITCSVCANSLISQNNFVEHSYGTSVLSLINIKNRGGLIAPRNDVIQTIIVCESVFKIYVSGDNFKKPKMNV